MTKDEVLEKLRSHLATAKKEYGSTFSPFVGGQISGIERAIALVEKLNQESPPKT